jgi:hypothetical protein
VVTFHTDKSSALVELHLIEKSPWKMLHVAAPLAGEVTSLALEAYFVAVLSNLPTRLALGVEAENSLVLFQQCGAAFVLLAAHTASEVHGLTQASERHRSFR